MATRKSSTKVGVRANGTLKKGYRFAKGGRVVKAKGLGAACVRQNPDGSSSTYTAHGGSNPCPNGGRIRAERNKLTPAGTTFGLGKRKPAKKRTTKRK